MWLCRVPKAPPMMPRRAAKPILQNCGRILGMIETGVVPHHPREDAAQLGGHKHQHRPAGSSQCRFSGKIVRRTTLAEWNEQSDPPSLSFLPFGLYTWKCGPRGLTPNNSSRGTRSLLTSARKALILLSPSRTGKLRLLRLYAITADCHWPLELGRQCSG